MTEPSTDAGRRLIEWWHDAAPLEGNLTEYILAIEAEAACIVTDKWLDTIEVADSSGIDVDVLVPRTSSHTKDYSHNPRLVLLPGCPGCDAIYALADAARAADPPSIDVNYQALAAAYDTGYNDGLAGRSRCRSKSYRIMSERDR